MTTVPMPTNTPPSSPKAPAVVTRAAEQRTTATSSATGLPQSYLGKRALDKTKLTMVPRSEAASAAHLALFQLQDIPEPETQMLGISVLFAAFAHRMQLDPQELHSMGLAVLRARDEGDTPTGNSLEVLRDFAAIRLMGVDTTFY